jgi:hypothetical protein
LKAQGELLLETKVYAYSQYKNLSTPVRLDPKEKYAVRNAFEFQPLDDQLTLLAHQEKRSPLGVGLFNKYVADVIMSSDMHAFTHHFMRTKLAFLVKSYGLTYEDLKADLYSYSIFSLRKAYPRFEHLGHMAAISKTAIKNRGLNIIEEQTTDKRQRLNQNSDGGYSAVHVNLDSIESASVAHSFLVSGLDGQSQSNWEEMFSLHQLLKSPNIKPNHRRFLSLLVGNRDEQFSEFLGVDNSELISSIGFDRYFTKACSFFSVTEETGRNFLSTLKAHLS